MGARYGQRDGHGMDRETSKHQAWVNGEMVLLQREGGYQHGEKQHLIVEMQGQAGEKNSS